MHIIDLVVADGFRYSLLPPSANCHFMRFLSEPQCFDARASPKVCMILAKAQQIAD
jgi:hypothetical protein